MLPDILHHARPKWLTATWVQCLEMQGVEPVGAHDRLRLARIDAVANGTQRGPVNATEPSIYITLPS